MSAPLTRTATRRALAGAAALALLLTACGSDDGGDTEASAAATPRSVTHAYGTVEVPAAPQRVVSVGYEDQENILNFGVKPVLQRDYVGDQPYAVWPWSRPQLGDAKPELFTEEMPYEKIAAARPDLIIAINSGIEKDAYERLSQIAPTIAHPKDAKLWEATWEQRLLLAGQVFGQEAKAQQQITEVGDRLAKIKAEHPEWAGQEAVSVTRWEGLNVDTEHPRGQALVDLGFTIPAAFAKDNELAVEEVKELDRDVVLWVNGDDDPKPFTSLKLRDTLTAHEEGREVYVDKYLTQAFSNLSPAAWGYVLDTLVPLLEAAADGDPATPVESSVKAGIAP